MDDAGIAAVNGRERAADSIGVSRNEDEVDVVGHQHPGPDLDAGGAGALGEQVAVEGVVLVAEEGGRPAIAALSDVVRVSGKDGTGKAGHALGIGPPSPAVKLVHCHRNSGVRPSAL